MEPRSTKMGFGSTCFNSCFVFNPAPYQAPVTAVAVTPAVRIIVRTFLGVGDMVGGVGGGRDTLFESGEWDGGWGQEMRCGNFLVGTSLFVCRI